MKRFTMPILFFCRGLFAIDKDISSFIQSRNTSFDKVFINNSLKFIHESTLRPEEIFNQLI